MLFICLLLDKPKFMGNLSLLPDQLMKLKKKKAVFLIHHVYDIACVWETLNMAWHVSEYIGYRIKMALMKQPKNWLNARFLNIITKWESLLKLICFWRGSRGLGPRNDLYEILLNLVHQYKFITDKVCRLKKEVVNYKREEHWVIWTVWKTACK